MSVVPPASPGARTATAADPRTSATAAAPRASARAVDPGRVVVCVLFAFSAFLTAGRGAVVLRGGGSLAASALELSCVVATLAFCLFVLRAYLRRGPAAATDSNPLVWLVAPVATMLPFVIPALPVAAHSSARTAVALVLILAGTAWSVWSVRHLATNLSIVPQARAAVTTGPYRLVRHPLYAGEVLAVTGMAVRGWHWSHAVLVLALLLLQSYRAVREEGLLRREVAGYEAYAARTWRIVPGLV